MDLLRRIKLQVLNGKVKELTVSCWQDLGLYLLNERRADLVRMETEHNTKIRLQFKAEYNAPPHFDIIKRSQAEEKEEMVMPPPLSLSTMAASMSEQAINEQKDYREEKLEALEKLTFEELRTVDIPTPQNLPPFERFNFSVRVLLMKRHGLYEDQVDDFKNAIREKVLKGTPAKIEPDDGQPGGGDTAKQAESNATLQKTAGRGSTEQKDSAARKGANRDTSRSQGRRQGGRRPISKTRELLESRSKDV